MSLSKLTDPSLQKIAMLPRMMRCRYFIPCERSQLCVSDINVRLYAQCVFVNCKLHAIYELNYIYQHDYLQHSCSLTGESERFAYKHGIWNYEAKRQCTDFQKAQSAGNAIPLVMFHANRSSFTTRFAKFANLSWLHVLHCHVRIPSRRSRIEHLPWLQWINST